MPLHQPIYSGSNFFFFFPVFRCAKANEPLTRCNIGTKAIFPQIEDDGSVDYIRNTFSFLGQTGPVYLFSDAISPEHVQGIYSLGPSYMYAFLDKEITTAYDNPLPSGSLDARDGLAFKMLRFALFSSIFQIFEACLPSSVDYLFSQASDGRKLFNVYPVLDHALDRKSFEATVMIGTQLCSRRRLLQQIIYCVGGVSVCFLLIAQAERYENEENESHENSLLMPVMRERLTAGGFYADGLRLGRKFG